ncbi:hypothetical protein VPNG_09359 [Cytospora leucostoma]|uniref:Uncharacterized protein n=1 Tax=Cytospora leucostoma TaxID=1230097 RepID=A0A423VSY3_9PEZI|nr:hypothetical protein VPNG_09359 [Cytospora leucostoma]
MRPTAQPTYSKNAFTKETNISSATVDALQQASVAASKAKATAQGYRRATFKSIVGKLVPQDYAANDSGSSGIGGSPSGLIEVGHAKVLLLA